jgi:thymidine kinase
MFMETRELIESKNSRIDLENSLRELSVDPIILDAYEYLENTQPEILVLNDEDVSPSSEQLSHFTAFHSHAYMEKARELSENSWEVLAVGSGMYGGKSTLSFYLLDFLEQKGYKPLVSIADVMGEDYVTGRSYTGPGNVVRMAERIGIEHNFDISENGKRVILLDEFSFLPFPIVENFINKCKERNIKVILTGLNSNYLGQPLDTFQKARELIDVEEECYSFIPGQRFEEPIGTSTVRYVRINGQWVFDMGILPLVVSKEKTDIVHYSPATYEQTVSGIFKGIPTIRDFILHPSGQLKSNQEIRLEALS